MFVLSDTQTFRPNLVNIARFGYMRFDGDAVIAQPIHGCRCWNGNAIGFAGNARSHYRWAIHYRHRRAALLLAKHKYLCPAGQRGPSRTASIALASERKESATRLMSTFPT